jgi:hypothetical protein
MPTEGKGSFNPVRKHSQLRKLCGNPIEALREFPTRTQIIVFGATAKSPNLARFLLRESR